MAPASLARPPEAPVKASRPATPVADLAAARPIHLGILDGIDTMAGGEGPWNSGVRVVKPGVLIAGLNPVCTDAVSTAVMIASLFLIIIVELLNSAIEWTIDYISTEHHVMAKRAKDMASAAVFLSYLNCIVVWAVILLAHWNRIAKLEFLRWPPHFLP